MAYTCPGFNMPQVCGAGISVMDTYCLPCALRKQKFSPEPSKTIGFNVTLETVYTMARESDIPRDEWMRDLAGYVSHHQIAITDQEGIASVAKTLAWVPEKVREAWAEKYKV